MIDKEWTEEDIQKLSEIPTLSNPNWMPKSKKGNELVEYVLELFHNHIDIIMKIINKNLLILSNNEKDIIYQSYQKLFNLNIDKITLITYKSCLLFLKGNPKKKNLGPKP